MKYFKPDLLAKYRSRDPDTAEAAATEWQRRAEAYRKHLKQIQDRLPSGVRQLLRSLTLHDAHLLTFNVAMVRGRPQFLVSYRLPGGDGRAGVLLRYDGVEGLKVVDHEPQGAGETGMVALYDEFAVSADNRVTHSILMTGGVELRIRFARLVVTRLTRVVAPGRGRPDIKEQLAAVEMATS
jgi:hypothetical protein